MCVHHHPLPLYVLWCFRALMWDLPYASPCPEQGMNKADGHWCESPKAHYVGDMGERLSGAPHRGWGVEQCICSRWWVPGRVGREHQERSPVSKGPEAFSQSKMQSCLCPGACLSADGTFEHVAP